MCARTTCRSCAKPTWSGCGQHVEQALRGVPKPDRCQGHAAASTSDASASKNSGGFLSRLMGGG